MTSNRHPDILRAFSIVPEGYEGYLYGSSPLLLHPALKGSPHLQFVKDVDLWIVAHEDDTEVRGKITEAMRRLGGQMSTVSPDYPSELDFRFVASVRPDSPDPLELPRQIQVFTTHLSWQGMLYTADVSCHAWVLADVEGEPIGHPQSDLPTARSFSFLSGADANPMDSLMRYVRFSQRYGAAVHLHTILAHVQRYADKLAERQAKAQHAEDVFKSSPSADTVL